MGIDKEKGLLAVSELRRRAEDQLETKSPEAGFIQSADETLRLLHELQVNQIELEMQNEELGKVRDELEKSLEKYSDLFDFAPMGYLTLDRIGTISAANLSGASLLGIERGRLLGRRLGLFISEESRIAFADFLEKVFISSAKEECELKLLKEGNPPLFVQIGGLVSASGHECRIALIDITKRKQMEEQALYLASFPHLNPNPVLEVNASGKVTYSNPATHMTLKKLGIAEEEVNSFIPSDMNDILGNWGRKDNLILNREIAIKDRYFEEAIFLTPELNVARIYSLDITKRKQVEKELELLNRTLEARVSEMVADLRRKDQIMVKQNSLAAMGEMISNIAHQWRNPLNNVALIIQNLQEEYDYGTLTSEDIHRDIHDAMEVLMQMSQTIDDFRSFFRTDKEKRKFLISEAVNRSMTLVSATLKSHNIQVEIITDDDVTVIGYQNEYSQVLLNFFSNTCDACIEHKHSVTNHRILIHITRENERSVLYFRDSCGGIPDDVLPKIFEPYFTTRGPDKGTGIGLYMSKMIIEQNMDGYLTASNVDGGAEFRIVV